MVTRFPDPDFTPPSPPFHVPHTVLYTKYPSKSCSSVVGGREKRARAFSRVSCACTAKHTRKESEAPGYADPSGTDFPESSAVCFRFHCRSIDLTGRCIKSHCVSTWDRDYSYPDLGACWLSSCHTSCRILAQPLKAAHRSVRVPTGE